MSSLPNWLDRGSKYLTLTSMILDICCLFFSCSNSRDCSSFLASICILVFLFENYPCMIKPNIEPITPIAPPIIVPITKSDIASLFLSALAYSSKATDILDTVSACVVFVESKRARIEYRLVWGVQYPDSYLYYMIILISCQYPMPDFSQHQPRQFLHPS